MKIETFVLPVVVCMVALALCNYGYAQEHPQEHPQRSKAEVDMSKEYSEVVENYVKETLETKKTLFVQNIRGDSVNIPGKLELVRIHKDKIVRYKDETYFACSDFVAKSGATKTNYDLDFFMTKTKESWKLDRILLHKVDGKLQFMYENNKPVPLKKEKPTQEHPK